MNGIKVNSFSMNDIKNSMGDIKARTSFVDSRLRTGAGFLDWQIKEKENVQARIISLQQRIERQEMKLEAYVKIIQDTMDSFEHKDRMLSQEVNKIVYSLKSCQYAAESGIAWYSLPWMEDMNAIFGVDKGQVTGLGHLRA